MPNYLSKLNINGTEFVIKDRTITPEHTPDRKILVVGDEEINRGSFKLVMANYGTFKWAQDAGIGFTMTGEGTGGNFWNLLDLIVENHPEEAETITDIIVLGGAHEIPDSDFLFPAMNSFKEYAFEHFPKLARLYLGFIPNTHLTGQDYDDLMTVYEYYKNYAAYYGYRYIDNIELVGRNNAFVQDPNDSFPVGLNDIGMDALASVLGPWINGSPLPDTFAPMATTLGGSGYSTEDHLVMYTQIIKGMLYVYLTVQQDFSLIAADKTGTWNSAHPMVIGSVANSGYCFGHSTNRMSGYTSVPTIYKTSDSKYYQRENIFMIKDGDVIINPAIYEAGVALSATIDRVYIEKFTQIGDAMYS